MEIKSLITSIEIYFVQGDVELGFRRLLDLVHDTHYMPYYEQMIEITEWKELSPRSNEEIIEKCSPIFKAIREFPFVYADRSRTLLSAHNITKNYSKNNFQLGPISLDLYPGQVMGLVGENGNGKTTLLTILAQELLASDGTINYNFSTPYKDAYDLRTRLAYVPQRTSRWFGSLQSNLQFALANNLTPIHEIDLRMFLMIARLGLWNYKDLDWDELSSGYKMRFELARTLLRNPQIMLLDEPLANLDVLAQQVILEDLKFICNSITQPIAVILSSQQLFEVEKVSDTVLFLKNGKTLNSEEELSHNENVIIELDTTADKVLLSQAFKSLQCEQIKFNGGIYILYFPKETNQNDILSKIVENQIDIVNFRDITHSSRRYFV